ncbi:MAG: hypothetical protein ACRDVW_10110 [Acidimicrobiales bacterium]
MGHPLGAFGPVPSGWRTSKILLKPSDLVVGAARATGASSTTQPRKRRAAPRFEQRSVSRLDQSTCSNSSAAGAVLARAMTV